MLIIKLGGRILKKTANVLLILITIIAISLLLIQTYRLNNYKRYVLQENHDSISDIVVSILNSNTEDIFDTNDFNTTNYILNNIGSRYNNIYHNYVIMNDRYRMLKSTQVNNTVYPRIVSSFSYYISREILDGIAHEYRTLLPRDRYEINLSNEELVVINFFAEINDVCYEIITENWINYERYKENDEIEYNGTLDLRYWEKFTIILDDKLANYIEEKYNYRLDANNSSLGFDLIEHVIEFNK